MKCLFVEVVGEQRNLDWIYRNWTKETKKDSMNYIQKEDQWGGKKRGEKG
jgi:hypothetical protein